ncbi:MAG: hypothetical protein ACRDDY_12920, partial [Clostridium sp.]|uniref:hypothetical protein n=1 Tax=Clostridium sp. TaxID=1506 RepID=UPI003EE5EC9C
AIYSLDLTKPYYHKELGIDMRGFTAHKDIRLQVMSQSKIDDLKEKTVDDMAIPCLIPMSGNSELNSTMWMDLKKKMKLGRIRFLIDESEFENMMSESPEYMNLDSYMKSLVKLPYVQTMFLCSELVNLTPSYSNGNLKLVEPRSGFKDRAVSCSYGNYIASKLEEIFSKIEDENEYDIEDWSFLGNF